jgi:hypothetical protein
LGLSLLLLHNHQQTKGNKTVLKIEVRVADRDDALEAVRLFAALARGLKGEPEIANPAEVKSCAPAAALAEPPWTKSIAPTAAPVETIMPDAVPAKRKRGRPPSKPEAATPTPEAEPLLDDDARADANAFVETAEETRETLIAALRELGQERGILWLRETVLGPYKAARLSDLTNDAIREVVKCARAEAA